MKDHLDMTLRFGADFAAAMVQRIMAEANGKTATGQAYLMAEPLRLALVGRAAAWKESLLVLDVLKGMGMDISKPQNGFKEIPKG